MSKSRFIESREREREREREKKERKNESPKSSREGWSGGARRPTNLDNSRVLAVGAGWGCLDIFKFVYLFSFLSPSFGDGPI